MLEIDKIYQVDCLDGMSKIDDKSVSLILTDPPYEISRDSNYAKSAPTGKDTDRFRISIDFGDWDKQEAFDIRLYDKRILQVLERWWIYSLFL